MSSHRDIESVRAFLLDAIEAGRALGQKRQVAQAQKALDAFERIAAPIEAAERAEQLRQFDDVFGPDAAWRQWPSTRKDEA